MERIESLSPESKVSRFCMEAGFMRVVEVGQYFMTKDTCDFRQLFLETIQLHNQKDGSRETRELDPSWKSRPVIYGVNMELKSESVSEKKRILILGSEYLMEQINMWLIQITTIQKSLQIRMKIKRHKQV